MSGGPDDRDEHGDGAPAFGPVGEIVAFPVAAARPPSEPDVSPSLVAAVEAMLFASSDPLGLNVLCDALGAADPVTAGRPSAAAADPTEVRAAIEVLTRRSEAADRGIELVEVAGGFQFRTKAAYASAVLRARGGKPQKLSGPALEVLAVVAYRQPVTRHDIDQVRGVDSGGPLRGLIDRGLVRVSGRRDEPGRPLEYATTPAFLELFGLPALSALPTLREREGLAVSSEDPDAIG